MSRVLAVVFAVLLSFPLLAERFVTGGPTTTDNDDSCDIALLPAATLLLPYFEVDANDRSGETTLFTVTNTTDRPQIARITLWTDFGYPVLDFNVWLTGYDTQSINLFDVIVRGIIASDRGTGSDVSDPGELSDDSNPLIDASNCERLPGLIPAIYTRRMIDAFTTGKVAQLGSLPGCNTVGSPHATAVGYATIDVARTCGVLLPDDPAYFQNEILWDNVFTGDFQQVNSTNQYAQGNPLVHIRAVPEGATAIDRTDLAHHVNLAQTFYSRYQSGATLDARQPLPARFVAHWISGGATSFQTSFKIWRAGRTTQSTACDAWMTQGGLLDVAEITMFDEDENPFAVATPIYDPPLPYYKTLPSTSRTDASDSDHYPAPTNGAVAGWMYFNLDDVSPDTVARQAWIVTSMRAEGRFSTDTDATALGNGCSPPVAESPNYYGEGYIGPSPNVNP
jgi:hypothetical protein